MNVDKFWDIVEIGKNSEAPESLLKEELVKLAPEEIAEFQEIFDKCHENAYRWDLWGSAYLIGGGCSDDGFTDFRYGLIAKGRDVYESSLKNPDTLAELGAELEIENESYGYVALEVYESRTSSEMPRSESMAPKDPQGEEWNFDDMAETEKRLPRLSSLFS